MPNWCNNTVSITHSDPEKLKALVDAVNGKEFLNYVLPVSELDNVDAWGTKWDVEAYDTVVFDPAGVTFGFDSAWSPPIPVYETLVEQGFSVCAFYYEPGMAFAGKWSDEDGDHCWEISGMTSNEVRDMLPEDLDDMMGISDNMAIWEEENT